MVLQIKTIQIYFYCFNDNLNCLGSHYICRAIQITKTSILFFMFAML